MKWHLELNHSFVEWHHSFLSLVSQCLYGSCKGAIGHDFNPQVGKSVDYFEFLILVEKFVFRFPPSFVEHHDFTFAGAHSEVFTVSKCCQLVQLPL